jgi:hypothetical protein
VEVSTQELGWRLSKIEGTTEAILARLAQKSQAKAELAEAAVQLAAWEASHNVCFDL